MVYEFLADGFEIVEAMSPVDILRRADIGIRTVAIDGDSATSSCFITVKADINGCYFDLPDDAEMVVFPGGMSGTTNLMASETIKKVLEEVKKRDIYAAAICAAPWIFDANGMLDGKQATMYPTMADDCMKNGKFTGEPVEQDGKIITGRGPGVSITFALKLVEVLKGEKAAQAVKDTLYPNF